MIELSIHFLSNIGNIIFSIDIISFSIISNRVVAILIHILISHALPSIFKQRELEDSEAARQDDMIRRLVPGGEDIIASRTSRPESLEPLAYYSPDEARDQLAAELVSHNQISTPTIDLEANALTFDCYSSLATERDPNPLKYNISLGIDGYSSCTCRDFLSRGGFCKHMRAAVARSLILLRSGINLPNVIVPQTIEDAYEIRAKRLAAQASISITASTAPSPVPLRQTR